MSILVTRESLTEETNPPRPLPVYKLPEKPNHKLILDSGAYSAWTRNVDIDIHTYAAFVEEHKEGIWYAVNLDKIPGLRGINPSPTEINEAAALSVKNSEVIRKTGVEPIPVFHQGESTYWLDKMIGDGYTYIGISPSNSFGPKLRAVWLDQIFDHICKGGHPTIRTHGFGVTSAPLIAKYPWFTVDSMRWNVEGAWGASLVPRSTNGEYDYTKVPYSIRFSAGELKPKAHWRMRMNHREGKVNQQKIPTMKSYSQFGPDMRAYIDKYLASIDFDAKGLEGDFIERGRANVRFFLRLEAQHNRLTFQIKRPNLFGNAAPSTQTAPSALADEKFRIVFAVNGTKRVSETPLQEGASIVLISYFNFINDRIFDLKTYARTGELIPTNSGGRKASKPKSVRRAILADDEIW